MYKFVLKYDNQLLNVQTDPIGWDEGSYTLRRSEKDGDGTFKNFNIDLTWIKDGAEFVRAAYQSEGIEAEVETEIYIWEPNEAYWEILLVGKLNMSEYEVSTDRGRLEITVPIENTQFETRFLSLRKKDVDLLSNKTYNGAALPAIQTTESDLHASTLVEEYNASLATSKTAIASSVVNVGRSTIGDVSRNIINQEYVAFGFENPTKDSLTTAFELGFGFTNDLNSVSNFFQFDFDTLATINLLIPFVLNVDFSADNSNGRVNCGNNGDLLQQLNVKIYFEWRDRNNVSLEKTLIGQNINVNLCGTAGGSTSAIISLVDFSYQRPETQFSEGDKLYLYADIRHEGDYHRLITNAYNVTFGFEIEVDPGLYSIQMEGKTTFNETSTEGILIYEALARLAEHYTGRAGSLYSDYYGRTDLGYAEDGEGSQRLICSGLQLRGFTLAEKPIYTSWIDFFASLEKIDAVGFGFELDAAGDLIVRVEKKEYFYEDDISIVLPSVKGLIKRAAKDLYSTTIEVGYNNWTGQKDVGTLEEYNSERQYYTGLTQIDNEKDLKSELVAGTYAIESTRRLQKERTDEDGTYDEDIFLIQVLPTGDTIPWLSESNENLESISGVIDEAGIYNIRLTPARMMLNWARIIASNFINFGNNTVSGTLRFASGKGNYEVVSKLNGEPEVSEGSDINMAGYTPIWVNEEFEFEYPLRLSEVNTLRANTKKAVGFTDNEGVQRSGFIKVIDIDLRTPGKSLSTFKLKRRYEQA